MTKNPFIYHSLALLTLLSPLAAAAPPFRVVIDPGHGGSDLGTTTDLGKTSITEKDVTLSLALEASRLLKSAGVETYLTRYDDKEIELGNRTAFANKIGASVFISLHMNSSQSHLDESAMGIITQVKLGTKKLPPAEGIETYILNNTTDASSKRLAHLENSVLGGKPQDGTSTDVALIIKDLRIDSNLPKSKRLACAVQTELVLATSKGKSKKDLVKRNRGIKQALFHVLLGADMPSVLVEVGFLSSPADRSFIMTKENRHLLAVALADGILEYAGLKKSSVPHFNPNTCQVREQP